LLDDPLAEATNSLDARPESVLLYAPLKYEAGSPDLVTSSAHASSAGKLISSQAFLWILMVALSSQSILKVLAMTLEMPDANRKLRRGDYEKHFFSAFGLSRMDF
jgi:hypothetical protein